MKTLLATLLLTATAMAGPAARDPYPSDYKPSPCAPANLHTFDPQHLVAVAQRLKRKELKQEWVDEHWAEIEEAVRPLVAKIANCLTIPGNSWLFCSSMMPDAFNATAERFPEGSADREQWLWTAHEYLLGLDNDVKNAFPEAQRCGAASVSGQRTLDVWMVPDRIEKNSDGTFTVYSLDHDTHIPVMADLTFEGQNIGFSKDSPIGKPITYFPVPWKVKFNRVPNADGHRDVVPPALVLKANGYQEVRIPMSMDVPKMTVEMTPPPSQLKPGSNNVTITARDADTGELVEARVMAGEAILGKTNKPFTLDLQRGQKLPEIWITNLFDRYSDVVVVKGK